jgi:hypothetical protein
VVDAGPAGLDADKASADGFGGEVGPASLPWPAPISLKATVEGIDPSTVVSRSCAGFVRDALSARPVDGGQPRAIRALTLRFSLRLAAIGVAPDGPRAHGDGPRGHVRGDPPRALGRVRVSRPGVCEILPVHKGILAPLRAARTTRRWAVACGGRGATHRGRLARGCTSTRAWAGLDYGRHEA